MFSIFMVALLSHLVGDYLLQSNFLFIAKSKAPLGALLHIFIVIATTSAFIMGIFGVSTWPLVVILCLSHFIVDILKSILLKSVRHNNIIYYLFDQGLHFATLFMVANIGKEHIVPLSDKTLFIVRVLVLMLIATVFNSLTTKVALANIYPKYYAKRPTFDPGERAADSIFGLSIFVALYAIPFWYLSVPVIILFTIMYFFAANTYVGVPLPAVLIKIILSLTIITSLTNIL